MLSRWVIFCMLARFAYVSADQCDIESPEECIEELKYYKTLFPLYGLNKDELDKTCEKINAALNCIESYSKACKRPECKEKCLNFSRTIPDFKAIYYDDEFPNLVEDLCEENGDLRNEYLKNVDCMSKSATEYADCHNDSKKSLNFILKKGVTMNDTCCRTSWYRNCFNNITNVTCGAEATSFMSEAILLFDETNNDLCRQHPINCDKPPLPEMNQNKPNDPNNTGQDKNKIVHHKSHDNNTSDPTHKENNAASATYSYTSTIMLFPYVSIMVFKYLL